MAKYEICPVPDCEGNVIPGQAPHGLCLKHEKDLTFLLFILPLITVQQRQKPETKAKVGKEQKKIIVPGDKDF